ncbi:MAG: alpha/beta hydrolase [Gemmatimonadales bacterium]
MAGKTATVRDIPIHYEELGEGRPVVLLHGFSVDHRVMIHAYEPIFAARPGDGDGPGWRRIYPDMPGHGATPAPGWLASEDDMLDVLVDFVDAVTGEEEGPVVIGSSWGAYLGHALANRRADRIDGLMLTVPVVRADRARRDLPPRTVLVSDPVAVADAQPGEELWPEIAVIQTLEMLARFRAWGALQPPDEAFQERLEPRYAFSFEDQLTARIEAPALIVAGRQDSIAGYRDAWPLLEHLPRATFAVLDRAGHALEDEQSGLFAALAAEWLDRVDEHIAG